MPRCETCANTGYVCTGCGCADGDCECPDGPDTTECPDCGFFGEDDGETYFNDTDD